MVFIINICFLEHPALSVPQTVIYSFLMVFGTSFQYVSFTEHSMKMSFPEKLQFVIDKKYLYVGTQYMVSILYITLATAVMIWINKTILQATNQMQLVMENFKVIVNSFDEAIISKTEAGDIGYCNSNGINFIIAIYKAILPYKNNKKIEEKLANLRYMSLAINK